MRTDVSQASSVDVDCDTDATIPHGGGRPKPTTPPPKQGVQGDIGETGPQVHLCQFKFADISIHQMDIFTYRKLCYRRGSARCG